MATQLLSVEDNTAPSIVLTLQRNNTAIDVTGATVDLIITSGGTQTNTGSTSCTLTTPTSGIVTYSPAATDFPTKGTYKCEIQITYSDATTEVLYESFVVKVRNKLTA